MSTIHEMKEPGTISPLAGRPAPKEMLVDLARLEREYYERKPDVGDPDQLVSFGTSGHRGSPLRGSFTESHIVAITQAICDYRRGRVGALTDQPRPWSGPYAGRRASKSMLRVGIWRQAEKSSPRGRPIRRKAMRPSYGKDGAVASHGRPDVRRRLRRYAASACDEPALSIALRYRSSRESCSSRSSLSCLRRRKTSLRTLTSKPSPLASANTSFLPSFNAVKQG